MDLGPVGECISRANKLVAVACDKSLLAQEGRGSKVEASRAILSAQAHLRGCSLLIGNLHLLRKSRAVDYIMERPIFLW